MRAAVFHGRGDVRIEDVPQPTAGPGQVVVRVGFNGICGSDLNEFYSGPRGIRTEPHPLTGAKLPQIMGHEFGGWVESLGEGVDDLELNTLVAVNPIYGCGSCGPCRRGLKNLCVVAAFHGLMADGGGLSERTVVHRSMVHPLPHGLDARHAALVEPMSVSFRSARRAEVKAGQHVLVLGGGPIGIGAMLAVKWMGATPIASEPSETRRDALRELGVGHVLDPANDDVVSAVLDLTDGEGAAATIDAVALPSTYETAFAATARGGNVVLVGMAHQPLPFDPLSLFRTEITLRASNAYADDFDAAIGAMAAGAFPLGTWVSTIPLDGLVSDGFEVLRRADATKILVALDAHNRDESNGEVSSEGGMA